METKPGDSFLKIGVGTLTKPDERAYSFSRLYEVVNPGRWTIVKQSSEVRFVHVLKDKEYSYEYEKSIRLVKDKPEMIMSHLLKNTGNKTIETSVYCHNFFVIDNQPVGPGYSVTLPFDVKGEGNGIGELAEIEGAKILRERGWDEETIRIVLSHYTEGTGVMREKAVDFALLACDEITGLIIATALVRPSKNIADVKLKSIRKKWKDHRFAAGVNRSHVEEVTSDFSRISFEGKLGLWDHIGNVLMAMQGEAEALELDGRLAK